MCDKRSCEFLNLSELLYVFACQVPFIIAVELVLDQVHFVSVYLATLQDCVYGPCAWV